MTIAAGDETDGMQLKLAGFEGPLDLLLELARRQEVDLAHISITAMVDQFVATVASIPRRDLARITDWLVMAAWLTWLKSRLLLPKDLADAKQGEQAGQVLIDRLAELDQVRTVMQWLDNRPQLGRDVFEHGGNRLPGGPLVVADLAGLFEACLAVLTGTPSRRNDTYVPPRRILWTAAQARARLIRLLPELAAGRDLLTLVPRPAEGVRDRLTWIKAALASTLVAALELAREALVELEQPELFGPITLTPNDASNTIPPAG